MNNKLGSSLIICLVLLMLGCAEPGEKTKVGATAGGVLGAGVGAIVGNQTGDAGSGLVVGALAGAGTGAAIGNALDEQDRTIAYQAETIERQGRKIQTQQAELDELRQMGQDQITFKGGHLSAPYMNPRRTHLDTTSQANALSYNTRNKWNNNSWTNTQPKIAENTVVNPDTYIRQNTPNNFGTTNTERGAFKWEKNQANNSIDQAMAEDNTIETTGNSFSKVTQNTAFNTPECIEAEAEVEKAQGAIETADQLFHFRRALRLCPSNPSFHNGLGEIYLSMSRREDAVYEFQQALEVDPNFAPAKQNMAMLQK